MIGKDKRPAQGTGDRGQDGGQRTKDGGQRTEDRGQDDGKSWNVYKTNNSITS